MYARAAKSGETPKGPIPPMNGYAGAGPFTVEMENTLPGVSDAGGSVTTTQSLVVVVVVYIPNGVRVLLMQPTKAPLLVSTLMVTVLAT